MPTVLITGASQGLGLEFARQYAAEGWSVLACCRDPATSGGLADLRAARPQVRPEVLDLLDPDSIEALAQRVGAEPIDVLLNNAGIIGPFPLKEHLHRQHFGTMDYGLWTTVLATNTFGPVHMAERFLPNVAASHQKKIATLSSTVGSIQASDRPAIAYATSKAAVNKAMSLLAKTLAPEGISVGIYCPGYVKTRMNVGGAMVEPADSAAGVRRQIAALTPENSGEFRRYDGELIPW